jgi:phosphate transport system substrate-binding protein
MNTRQGERPARPRRWLIAVVAALAAALAVFAFACNDDDNGGSNGNGDATEPSATDDSGNGGEIDYGPLSGDIRVDGSSTVFPISEAVAEEFGLVSDVRVNVAQSGTGGGFERFCRGEIQVSDASRPIKAAETQACADSSIADIIDFQVAIDALTVVVNGSNDFVDCLTLEELHRLFSDTSITRWSDLNPEWPDEEIRFYYPGTDSGTFDYFVEAVLEGVDENATHRADGFSSENDNELVTGIEGDEFAVGYFGFAYYQAEAGNLKAVAIDNGSGCVEPSLETARDGTYTPLSRPLFIYTRESFLQDRPEVLGFVHFYLENAEALVEEVGYVPLSDDVLAQQKAKLEPFLP